MALFYQQQLYNNKIKAHVQLNKLNEPDSLSVPAFSTELQVSRGLAAPSGWNASPSHGSSPQYFVRFAKRFTIAFVAGGIVHAQGIVLVAES